MRHYIFGYGSLVNQKALFGYLERICEMDTIRLCQLKGFRRCWNVAMDNRVNLPDYKYYVDVHTGQRPEIYITFLNIIKAPDTAITGILFEVGEEELCLLDKRERNYYRLDITTQMNIAVQGKVWVYKGTPDAEKRYQHGMQSKTACISEEYYHFVKECFLGHGEEYGKNYLDSTDTPKVPLRKLKRIDL